MEKSTGLRRSHVLLFLGMITLSALMGRFLLAMWYTNRFDTDWYLMWAADLQQGFWNCYDGHVRALDYPPLYLCLLKPVGALLEIDMIANYMPYRMLLIKFWPILFDTAIIPAIYFLFRRENETAALLGACLWAVNPSAIFNCAAWGQTDSIMTLMLLLTFWAFHERRPLYGTFLFALSCLMKMQSLYFAPVVLCVFLRQRDWKGLAKALCIGFGTVVLVFLPFMIASNNYGAIVQVYFGGFGKYPYVNLNAFNLWGIQGLNWVEDSTVLFGPVTYNMVSTFLMLFSFAGVMYLHTAAPKANVWLSGALLMQCLFILTTRQHERYQYIVMILLLGAYLTCRHAGLLGLFGGVTFVSFWNQALLLGKNIHSDAPWVSAFPSLQSLGSVINVLLFIVTVVLCVRLACERRPMKGVSA
ncbi:MAG: DUF2029 domain-containing protein [Clostridia bacterium]|nr:DUF2029 domain-containing protein [Clostridia bacterium]